MEQDFYDLEFLETVYFFILSFKSVLSSFVTISPGLVTFRLAVEDLKFFLYFLKYKSEFQFLTLIDLFCVDYPHKLGRFELNYILLSIFNNFRVSLKVSVPKDCSVPSISSMFPSSVWLEREVWDMFGVYFYDHPDLRRILTDYGFVGFPLRKDFPLTGFLEVGYDDQSDRVVLEPVRFSQGYRYFDFSTPWMPIRIEAELPIEEEEEEEENDDDGSGGVEKKEKYKVYDINDDFWNFMRGKEDG
jgi:NADH-quinone oxidoreductase subunit C